MRFLTKKCMFDPTLNDWALTPIMVEVNSAAELKRAIAEFVAEVKIYRAKTSILGGNDGQD